MPSIQFLPLPTASIATRRSLKIIRYGKAGSGPKAYFQASLHADELPGILVQNHLRRMLDAAEERGDILGEIVMLPIANPIGLDQHVNGTLMGRFELASGTNFNRLYPDYTDAVIAAVSGKLGRDGGENVRLIRSAMSAAWRADERPRSEADALRWQLYGLAHDADMIFDLHCDWEAVMHLYTSSASWPDAEDVSRQMGSRATLLAEVSGDEPFDEAMSYPWVKLRKHFSDAAIPQACLSITVELRGQGDVDDDLAQADADNLFKVLQRRGVIAGDPGPLPKALCEATELAAVDIVRAPSAGVVAYRCKHGDIVQKGDLLGYVVDPMAEPGEDRTPFYSGTTGVIYGRIGIPLVRPNDVILKIAGKDVLDYRKGKLLTA